MDTTMDRDHPRARAAAGAAADRPNDGRRGRTEAAQGLIDAIVAAGSSTNGGGDAKPAPAKRAPKADPADRNDRRDHSGDR